MKASSFVSRLMQQSLHRSLPIRSHTLARHLSGACSKVPVLEIAEVGTSIAASRILQQAAPSLRGIYDTFVCAGFFGEGSGKTLEGDLANIKLNYNLFEEFLSYHPDLDHIVSIKHNLTSQQFCNECYKLLGSLNLNAFGLSWATFVHALAAHDKTRIELYETLKQHKFNYKNINETFESSNVEDLLKNKETTIKTYAKHIAEAYFQGKKMITMLKIGNLSNEVNSIDGKLYNRQYKTVSDRLTELSIPQIKLFPFIRDHEPADEFERQLRQRVLPEQQKIDPTIFYAVDVSGQDGVKNLMQAVNKLMLQFSQTQGRAM